MKEVEIEITGEIYERAIKLAEKLGIGLDELFSRGVRKLAEEHLKKDNENETA